MADFKKAIKVILLHEGGYVFDKRDPGGETNFGISKKSYPDLDIKKLTVEQATEIYLRDYWLKLKLEQINDDRIALIIFDHAVNTGTHNTIRMVQKSVGVEVDGVIGNVTIKAVNQSDSRFLILDLCTARGEFYINLVNKKPLLRVFKQAWLNRVTACQNCEL